MHYVRPDDPTILNYLPNNKIILGNSEIHGRGVFALEDIPKGSIIERCPMIQMDYRSKYQLDPQIFNYMYAQPPCSCNECKTHGFIMHMVGGYGMLYNHQDDPDGKWRFNYTQLLADLIAVKDIKKGSEIFINYGVVFFTDKEKKHAENS